MRTKFLWRYWGYTNSNENLYFLSHIDLMTYILIVDEAEKQGVNHE